MLDKASLRKHYIEKRKALTTSDIETNSVNILSHLKELPVFSHIRNLHMFYPMTGKKEVDTLLIVNWLRDEHPDIRIILPKSNLQTHTLEHIIWTDETPLAMNEWGITEPEYGELINPQEIDVVFMPLLAFDKKGNRIGYGKGFYDRFLTECREDTLKVGLSYFEPEEQFIEVGEFDIPLDACVTPEKVWQFKVLY